VRFARVDLTEIRRAFGLLAPAMRWRWLALLPLALAGAAAEAVGALTVFALLRVIADPSSVERFPATAALRRIVVITDARSAIVAFAALLAGIYLLRNALLTASAWARARVVYGSVAELSRRTYTAYLRAPFALAGTRNSAAMIQRVQRASEVVPTLVLASVINVTAEVLVVAGLVGLLAVTAPLVTLLAVAGTTLLLLVPGLLTSPLFSRWGAQERDLNTDILRQLHEGLGGLKEVKLNERESFFEAQFARLRQQLSRIQRKREVLSESLRVSVETAFALILVIVIMALTGRGEGGYLVSVLGLYAYAGFRLIPSVNRITLNLNSLRQGLPFASDLADELSVLIADTRREAGDAVPPMAFSKAIAFDAVSYTYARNEAPAVGGVNLTIERGQSIGIIGATGAGKSTMLDLLLGLIAPTAGRVLVDGHDIREAPRAWQRQIGYVSQTPYMLDDTVRRNVAFGLPGDAIDEPRLRAAVSAAQLDDVVAALPQGLDTTLGDRGARLSGGQRQRVAIARALYRDPAVLVLDEATAALDSETEREVNRAIESLHGTRTVIVVAHRLSTVRRCDRIVVLREGRIAAVGSYTELLETDPNFQRMVDADAAP
jgi:ATP-binding cassette, subfamily B, bacterial PglK